MNRRALLATGAAAALAPIIPAVAAPAPLILTVIGTIRVRSGETPPEHSATAIYTDGSREEVLGWEDTRKLHDRFIKQWREVGYPDTNCPYIPARLFDL